MRSFEATKIVGAILFVGLVVMTIKVMTNHLYGPEAEGPAPEAAAPAAPEEKAAPEAAAPEAAAPAPEEKAVPEAEAKPEAEAEAEAKPEEEAAAEPEAKPEEEAKPAEEQAAVPTEGDPEAGAKVFKAHLCFGCHTFKPGVKGAGPSLVGVFGAKAGHMEGFDYSGDLANSGIVWNEESLDKWVERPKAVVPGTKMILAKPVTDAKDRADLIAFLKQESAKE